MWVIVMVRFSTALRCWIASHVIQWHCTNWGELVVSISDAEKTSIMYKWYAGQQKKECERIVCSQIAVWCPKRRILTLEGRQLHKAMHTTKLVLGQIELEQWGKPVWFKADKVISLMKSRIQEIRTFGSVRVISRKEHVYLTIQLILKKISWHMS